MILTSPLKCAIAEFNCIYKKKNMFNEEKINTVKPRYSAFQGTGQNHALYRGFHYCLHINNCENTSWEQNLYALLVE